jgi:RNA polymerase sigma-70 factor (ECF subfamily)
MDNPDIQQLLGRIADGDEAAFTELYRTWSRRLYAYALRQLGDHAKAEEIVSDTLYDVWRAPTRFRGESQFGTWLIGIARHKILMAWRARKSDATHDHEDLDEVAESVASDDDSAFDVLAKAQRREAVVRCIERLPDEQRECMHFVFYEGLSLAEVAVLQNVPEGTVKTRLFHARRKLETGLRTMLRHEGEAPAGAPR